jgi:hypothetical protein
MMIDNKSQTQSMPLWGKEKKDGKKMAREVDIAEAKGEKPIGCNWVMKKSGSPQKTLVTLTNF